MDQTPTSTTTVPPDLRRFIIPAVSAVAALALLSAVIFGVLNHRPSAFKVFPSGTMQRFSTGPYQAANLVYGPGGNIWFTTFLIQNQMESQFIGRMTPTGTVSVFPVPDTTFSTAGTVTQDINIILRALLVGSDGNLWFERVTAVHNTTENSLHPSEITSSILRMTPSGAFTDYPVMPIAGSSAYYGTNLLGLVVGPDGSLWCLGIFATEQRVGSPPVTVYTNFGHVGRFTPSVGVTWLAQPTFKESYGLVSGPDQALWVADGANDGTQLDRITPTDVTTSYLVPIAFGSALTIDADGALWLVGLTIKDSKSVFGRFNLDHHTTQLFAMPQFNLVGVTSAPLGRDGTIWFTASPLTANGVRSLAHITTGGVVKVIALPAGDLPTMLTAGADGNMWFSDFVATPPYYPPNYLNFIVRLTP